MSPAEHYAEAERLLAKVEEATAGGAGGGEAVAAALAAAQVHATLATVSAVVADAGSRAGR